MMTEKYYDYDHIDDIIDEAIRMLKLIEELDIVPRIQYSKLPDTMPYNSYEIATWNYLEYYKISIRIEGHEEYDYYEVSKKDYSVKYSYSCDLKER